jgi:hypothetical protein
MLKISYKALLNKIKEYEIEKQYRELAREQISGDSWQVAGARVR